MVIVQWKHSKNGRPHVLGAILLYVGNPSKEAAPYVGCARSPNKFPFAGIPPQTPGYTDFYPLGVDLENSSIRRWSKIWRSCVRVVIDTTCNIYVVGLLV